MNKYKHILDLKSKKILILLPDGVGLRNFAFTSFVEKGEQMGWDVLFWNQTPFDLKEIGYNEIKLQGKPKAITDLIKRAKTIAELDHFTKKFDDQVYQSYKFPYSNKDLKSNLKNALVSILIKTNKGELGVKKLREQLKRSERKSRFYKKCKELLEREKPDFIFCTNQRPVTAISPLTAAQDLGIQTGTFIFSWDNLPKATMIVEPDFYFVWSNHMKEELLKYYPFINSSNILITGSPQFEIHSNANLIKKREDFFSENNLNLSKDYICFSGDDKTTSPDDANYLKDVAESIEKLNETRKTKIGILFRRCPVDFSDRYNTVLEKHKDLIVPLVPKWKQVGGSWNTILPTVADQEFQLNTIFHTKAVINLGSSMVFDFALLNKPCMFLNYDVDQQVDFNWSSKKVYKFVHFRSMPNGNEVIWLNSKNEIGSKLNLILNDSRETVTKAQIWFDKINMKPAAKASIRIWESIDKIVK